MSPSMLVTDGADSGVGIFQWFPKYMLSATIERKPNKTSRADSVEKQKKDFWTGAPYFKMDFGVLICANSLNILIW